MIHKATWVGLRGFVCAMLLGAIAAPASAAQLSNQVTAIVGATVIDGNGGAPLRNATVVISGKRIMAVGPRSAVEIPEGARIIDGSGKFVTPGFIDTNVHVSGVMLEQAGNALAFDGTSLQPTDWYGNVDITLEGAQMQLKYGVTTIRDSYGALLPLIQVRDAIARGDAVGPRVLVAGNIVGWGGPYSVTFRLIEEYELSPQQEYHNDFITQGSGEELMEMYPDELRIAINAYLDKGPDFIKYGGTSHWGFPNLIGFSPLAQSIIVEETHRRGLFAETHATSPEGLRLAVEAGVDLIQHPEVVADREISDELVRAIVERGIVCSMLVNTITGEAWQAHLHSTETGDTATAAADGVPRFALRRAIPMPKTSAADRRARGARGVGLAMRRHNAQKLIDGGCIVSIGTDNWNGLPPWSEGSVVIQGQRITAPKPVWQEPGIGTIIAIEGLVELGLSPGEAIVAATKHGAFACNALDELGTVERGKLADLLLLDANPLEDISNVRKLSMVMKEGQIVDIAALPTNPIFFKRSAEGKWPRR